MSLFVFVSTRPEDEALLAEYQSFLRASGMDRRRLELVRFNLGGLPKIDLRRYAGVIVSGSPYGTLTPTGRKPATQVRTERELTRLFGDVFDRSTPCLATGYGMEVACTLLGAPLTSRWAEDVGVTRIRVTEEGRSDPILAGFPAEFTTFVGHREACDAPPAGASVLASSEGCPIQMLRNGESFYAAQFHPELDADVIQQRLATYRDAGYVGADDVGSLVLLCRNAPGHHQAGRIVRNFVEHFG